MEWSVIEQGQGAINMNPWCRMRVHQLKMIKRSDCIYWSQVDYKSPARCSHGKGKWNFKMHQEKCFDRSRQLLKTSYKTAGVGETSSERCHPTPIMHINKTKLNSHQNKWGHELHGWPANIRKVRKRTVLLSPKTQVQKCTTELWLRPSHSQTPGSLSHNFHNSTPSRMGRRTWSKMQTPVGWHKESLIEQYKEWITTIVNTSYIWHRVLICFKVGRLCRRTWADWINGAKPAVWSLTRSSAESCTWVTTIPWMLPA